MYFFSERFVECMEPFIKEARSQLNEIKSMLDEMETCYTELEAYFVFKKTKYPIEDFLLDIKLFKDQFKVQIIPHSLSSLRIYFYRNMTKI